MTHDEAKREFQQVIRKKMEPKDLQRTLSILEQLCKLLGVSTVTHDESLQVVRDKMEVTELQHTFVRLAQLYEGRPISELLEYVGALEQLLPSELEAKVQEQSRRMNACSRVWALGYDGPIVSEYKACRDRLYLFNLLMGDEWFKRITGPIDAENDEVFADKALKRSGTGETGAWRARYRVRRVGRRGGHQRGPEYRISTRMHRKDPAGAWPSMEEGDSTD